MTAPSLTIVIVSYNARRYLEACLRSLVAAPPALSHQIVVVDNASNDGSPAVVEEVTPEALLIQNETNVGFARATNQGIRATVSEAILLLNSDTEVPPQAIDRLVDALRADPEAAVVGPRIVDRSGSAELSFGRMISPFNELRQKTLVRLHAWGVPPVSGWVERATRTPQYADWVSGACLLVWREAAQRIGLLDERYFIYGEDVDFCAAIRANGWRVRFVPDVTVVHVGGRSVVTTASLTSAAYRRSQLAFYAKHHAHWVPWLRWYLRLRGKLDSSVHSG